MGILDRLFRKYSVKPAEAPLSPDALRELLFESVDHPAQLLALCKRHQEQIVLCAPLWQTLPEDIRKDRQRANEFMRKMIAVLNVFDRQLHDDRLHRIFVGPEDSNPIALWNQKLSHAATLLGELRFQDAIELLSNALIDTRQLGGDGADHLRGLTRGMLGHCCFNAGDMNAAIAHYRAALQACEQESDASGTLLYLQQLYESHRYAADPGPAAELATRIADFFASQAKDAQAAWYRKQAQIVRAGEPLNRMVMVVNDQKFETDAEMPKLRSGSGQFIFVRNRPALPGSTKLVQRGMELARAQKYDEALSLFREAAELDPYDPDPHLKQGQALIGLRYYAQAVDAYQTCERLAPGWFNCRSDVWIATQLETGKMPHELYLTLWFLEDASATAGRKLEVADAVASSAQDIPLFHLLRSRLLADLGRKEDSVAACRQGLSLSPEPDVESRLLTQLGSVSKDDEEATGALRRSAAMSETGNLMATTAARFLLQNR